MVVKARGERADTEGMVSSLRRLGPWALLALAGMALLVWLGLGGFAFSDYDREVAPSYLALAHGDVGGFLSLAPAYGGSLIMRAPLAMLPDLWGGGELAVFRAAGLPCLLAGVALGVVLAGQMLARSAPRGTIVTVVCLCAVNPITLRALDIGHPEELLGAVLSAGAVLAALRGRSTLAGVLLGLAVANKAWALLAVGPVLLALQADRGRALAIAGRDRGGVHGAVVPGVLFERAPGRRGRDRRDLPAMAGVVVPRLDRRGDPRQ